MRHRKAYNGIQNVIERDTLMVVQCKGKLVAGVTDILQNEVKPLIPRMKRIVIDLSDVTHMDSSGLGTIISLYVSAKSAGCDMRLINLGKRIRELIRIANLLTLFELYGEHSRLQAAFSVPNHRIGGHGDDRNVLSADFLLQATGQITY